MIGLTAKCLQAQTDGVVNICDQLKRDWGVFSTNVSEVWGVGRRIKAHLDAMGYQDRDGSGRGDREEQGVHIEEAVRPCFPGLR